jgi:aspartate/tyrosine/aromatic aminotransferase
MFKSLPTLPMDPTFALLDKYKADPREDKINLGIGLYSDREGNPFVFDVVKQALDQLDRNNFNYQPIGGNREFLELAAELFFGRDYDKERLAMQSTCGGTQACRCFADLAVRVLHSPKVQLGVPTWVNYYALFQGLEVETFEHLNSEGDINFQAHLEAAKRADEGSAFVLQGGLAHNPSGLNLSLEQLAELIDILEEKNMILFMDMAYFGLGEGLERDRKYIQMCFDRLERFAVGVSFSKNASLYEQRTGALFIKTVNISGVETQLQKSIRETISTPPGFGQELITTLLRDYRKQWLKELDNVRQDIDDRRSSLLDLLSDKCQKLRKTRGMFGLLPLNLEQVVRLREEFGIYLLENGRINFSGIREKDIPYIGESIQKILA